MGIDVPEHGHGPGQVLLRLQPPSPSATAANAVGQSPALVEGGVSTMGFVTSGAQTRFGDLSPEGQGSSVRAAKHRPDVMWNLFPQANPRAVSEAHLKQALKEDSTKRLGVPQPAPAQKIDTAERLTPGEWLPHASRVKDCAPKEHIRPVRNVFM